MTIRICPECGGEGSHEIPHPQRDDPFYCAVEQCRHCGGVGRVEEDGPPICGCCNGRGEVGGVLADGSWQTDKCPECGGTGADPNPLNDPGPCHQCGERA